MADVTTYNIDQHITKNRLSVLVKPNALHTEILGWDESRKALRIAIAAPPDKNKANVELIKFLSKALSKKVVLLRGQRSREKVVGIVDS